MKLKKKFVSLLSETESVLALSREFSPSVSSVEALEYEFGVSFCLKNEVGRFRIRDSEPKLALCQPGLTTSVDGFCGEPYLAANYANSVGRGEMTQNHICIFANHFLVCSYM